MVIQKNIFQFQNNLLKKNNFKNFIYTGCQILNKSLFDKHKVCSFPVSKLWKELLKKKHNKNFVYIGCQILNKNLFNGYNVESFPVSKIWDELLIKDQLNGFESLNKFYHLTNLKTFKKLQGF